MKNLILGACLALGLCATPAAAALTITYSGTTFAGTDTDGIFVSGGGSLAGLAFTAVYTVQDGAVTTFSSNESDIYSGAYFGAPSYISAVLTINGNSFTIDGDYEGTAQRVCCAPSFETEIGNYVADLNAIESHELNFAAFSFNNDFSGSIDVASPLDTNVDGAVNYDGTNTPGQGFFYLRFYDAGLQAYGNGAYGNFAIEHVTVAGTLAPVPEPGAWAMLLMGVAATGVTARRRRGSPPDASLPRPA